MLISTLKQIGLNEKQARIYLACLELGKTSIKEIAKKSGIKRTSIYDFIDEMVDSGYLRQTVEGKKKRYLATEPEELNIIIKKREVLLAQILPELTSLSNVNEKKPKVWFYNGVEGLKKVYEDLLRYKDMVVCGWASEDIPDLFGKEWTHSYIKRRVKRNIHEKMIFPISQTGEEYRKFDREHKRESKIVDPKKYNFEIEINIYKDRLAMTSAKDKIGVIIESEPIVNTWKNIFDLCWDNLPEVNRD